MMTGSSAIAVSIRHIVVSGYFEGVGMMLGHLISGFVNQS